MKRIFVGPMLARRALLSGLLLPILARPGSALEAAAAIAALNRPDIAKELRDNPERIVVSPWGTGPERLTACAILSQDNDAVMVALLREDKDGRADIVAGPGEIPAVKIDPFWTTNAKILSESPLGWAPAIAVQVNNSYLSTSRSTMTDAVHIFLRREKTLLPVFAGLTAAAHSEGKQRWRRAWRIVPEGRPNADGVPPALTVRNASNGAVVSRHRWKGDAYHPKTFERTPSL